MGKSQIPIEDEVPKYRKKSQKKGKPRADHKHEYKTVLLHRNFASLFDDNHKSFSTTATKVCAICGRIGYVDHDQYELVEISNMPYRIHEKVIKNKESLEKWYCDDYFDKFAHKKEV